MSLFPNLSAVTLAGAQILAAGGISAEEPSAPAEQSSSTASALQLEDLSLPLLPPVASKLQADAEQIRASLLKAGWVEFKGTLPASQMYTHPQRPYECLAWAEHASCSLEKAKALVLQGLFRGQDPGEVIDKRISPGGRLLTCCYPLTAKGPCKGVAQVLLVEDPYGVQVRMYLNFDSQREGGRIGAFLERLDLDPATLRFLAVGP